MNNIDKVSSALSQWIFKVAAGVLPKFNIPMESAIGKFMYGILGVDPRTYSIWNELGFLAEPMVEVFVAPMINKYLGGLSDEQVKEVTMKLVDAMQEQVAKKGSINLFGLELGRDAFDGLKQIMTERLENPSVK